MSTLYKISIDLVTRGLTFVCSQLLTHTSGLAYDAFTPELLQWRASRGETASLTAGTLIHRYSTPLMFEPGESFAYSSRSHSMSLLPSMY